MYVPKKKFRDAKGERWRERNFDSTLRELALQLRQSAEGEHGWRQLAPRHVALVEDGAANVSHSCQLSTIALSTEIGFSPGRPCMLRQSTHAPPPRGRI